MFGIGRQIGASSGHPCWILLFLLLLAFGNTGKHAARCGLAFIADTIRPIWVCAAEIKLFSLAAIVRSTERG
jgi:hypothetical protein